ncbi:PREDICTED: zinc finger CCCH domain-containing protein 20-like [Ipomoea nil]|uniref:zinc finger CCCH domain-containing protein 20-like n=1 Tax=Ipomoea nil TaxID=35883 RepID=UPI00090145DE|nr:PREDICTED: zinc finger CCCH domain-containing protein 20-like [Ipomoea nil]
MMIGERNLPNPTVLVPPWLSDDPTANIHFVSSPGGNANFSDDVSQFLQNDAVLQALQRYLPSNDAAAAVMMGEFESDNDKDVEFPVDAYACDNFRMYDFKVRKCARGRSHDWTECPFAHPGEKARRRDPRKYRYSGAACPDFRKGNCRKGDLCEFAHGVFECWLHPARYRTQPCKDGVNCKRRVCFFAHSPEQLRVLSPRADGYGFSDASCAKTLHFVPSSSPESGSPPSESPPMSPMNSMVASLRQLQLNKVKSMPASSWSVHMLGSPRLTRSAGFCSLPTTPTRSLSRPGVCNFDLCEEEEEEEVPMERVESGRDLRAKMLEKLSKENPLDAVEAGSNPTHNPSYAPSPDLGWVSDLIQ